MSEEEPVGEAVADCPACGAVAPHAVLKDGGQATVRCEDCGHVHKARLEEPDEVERRVVVSQGGEDLVVHLGMPADQTIHVGEEFVVDADEAVVGVEVTSLEIEREGDNDRVDRATAEEVDTVWTVAVDNVAVPVTLHRDEGTSEGHEITVPGDYTFVVGDEETVEGVEATVSAFMTDRGDRFRYEGDDVEARNVKRLYCEAR